MTGLPVIVLAIKVYLFIYLILTKQSLECTLIFSKTYDYLQYNKNLIFINHQQPSGGNFKQSTSQIKPSINYIYIYIPSDKNKSLVYGFVS